MPANPGTKCKATSPSKSIQNNVTNNWGKQAPLSGTPASQVAASYNKKPVSVKGGK